MILLLILHISLYLMTLTLMWTMVAKYSITATMGQASGFLTGPLFLIYYSPLKGV